MAVWFSARGGIRLVTADVVLHELANASDTDTVLLDTDHPPAGLAVEWSSVPRITSPVSITGSILRKH
jgi:hypothetical protein